MTFRTDKDLKLKKVCEKKVYILVENVNTKRKFEIKAKQNYQNQMSVYLYFVKRGFIFLITTQT